MPLPQIGGSSTLRSEGSNSVVLDISAVPVGGWMIVSVMSSIAVVTIAPPGGWTLLKPRDATGTRSNMLFGKVRDGADANLLTFTQNTTQTVAYALLWGTNGAEVANWTVGSSWLRSDSEEPAGARHTNQAPSISTPANDYLAIAISQEATNAKTQDHEVVSFTSGWTERVYLEQVAPNNQIETIWIATKEMPTAGATGDVTVTYESAVEVNGWGVQLAIPYAEPFDVSVPAIVGTPMQIILSDAASGFTINRPSGLLNGDYVIVAIRGQQPASVAPTSPGFTRLGSAYITGDASSRMHGLYGRPVFNAASEPSSYTFSYAVAGGRMLAIAYIVRGVDLNNPVAGFYDSFAGDVITGGRSIPSYTIDSAPSLSLFFASSEFSASSNHVPVTTPAGFTNFLSVPTNISTTVSRSYVWIGKREETVSPTVAASITWASPSGSAAEMVTLRGTVSVPISQEGEGVTAHDGNGDPTKVYYVSPDGIRTPSEIVPMRRGFNTVAEMLATPGFTWAHRGGSASYPEHSLYAYTQAVARGYGVLEISLGRTSDGVWFGLHDQTTDRTSGGTFGNASSQTWAQIQAQQIVGGGQGAPQPYMRWDELISTYGQTHIIVADPKYALGSYQSEFLTMVNNDLGPTRAIIKYSGGSASSSALSLAAQALGFQTWGFFYAADASSAQGGNGALQTWGPNWTLIGMDHGASQAIWNEALALGKPVIGHIAATQAAYDAAMAKGAIGVQISGVSVVDPVSWWT